jgi:hypothetical protein
MSREMCIAYTADLGARGMYIDENGDDAKP